jgi:hypothetical protein
MKNRVDKPAWVALGWWKGMATNLWKRRGRGFGVFGDNQFGWG